MEIEPKKVTGLSGAVVREAGWGRGASGAAFARLKQEENRGKEGRATIRSDVLLWFPHFG
jgi:hypothetical protein